MQTTVIGARGYLGRELIRLLLAHPEIDRVVPASTSEAGQPFGQHVTSLRHRKDLIFEDPQSDLALDSDVVFMATPAGVAGPMTQAYEQAGCKLSIDLSRDHRLQGMKGEDGWTYGLADVKPVAKGSTRIANPGCYPTASLLAMAPALQAGLVAPGPIIVDGKSGVSGAGVTARDDLHFPEMNETVRAYKVLGHDHTYEIQACAESLNGSTHPVRFTPHLVPQTRGLLSTVYLPAKEGLDAQTLQQTYAKAYEHSRFVRFVDEASTAPVRSSNHADVAVDFDPDTGLIVARGAIDNLQKGGSGTAIQNMNDAMGWSSDLGLGMTGGAP